MSKKSKSKKNKKLKKRKPKQLKKEWTHTKKDRGCENISENKWARYTNSSPSSLCKSGEEEPICICSRRHQNAKIKLLCGNCKIAFRPQSVNGKKIGTKVNSTDSNKNGFEKPSKKEDKTKTDKPKAAKKESVQSKSNKTSKENKMLEWFESDTDSECEDDEGITYNTNSPSTLCESEEETEKKICLCVRKGEKKKHVCGTCRLTYKPKRIKKQ